MLRPLLLRLVLASAPVLSAVASSACSAPGDGGSGVTSTGGALGFGGAGGAGGAVAAGGSVAAGGTTGAGAGISLPGTGATGADTGSGGTGATCVATVQRGEGVPLDMFVIWDRSGSMEDDVNGGTKWELVTAAFGSFVNDPSSAGIGVGLAYFPLFIDPNARNDRNDQNTVCDINAYAVAAVPIAPLPGNAAAVTSSLGAAQTGGRTPTRVALAGAIQYASTWATQHPERKTVVVLQTDGEPNVCESTVQAVAQVATAGVSGTPSMQTYVIGVGEELRNLNEIAQAGGTGDAFIVDTSQDTAKQFIDAMNGIRASASVSCEFLVPADGTIDYAKVNVTITPSNGSAATPLARAAIATDCDPQAGGWYYDNPANPARVLLCPASCSAVKADTKGTVELEIGCASRPITIR